MESIEREEYKKRMNLYKKLGAEDFQKVVFEVERIKFKLLKKLCPNFIKHYDKYCDGLRNKMIKKAKSEKDIQDVNRCINFYKLEMRREFNKEQNRNYHMNPNDSNEILKYLNWNKEVHQTGLAKDLVLIPLVTAGSIFITPWLTPLLAYELFSAFINFECINIQNYNICRYKLLEDKIKVRQERKVKATMEEYGDVAKIISNKIDTCEKLPSMVEIIESLEDKEQAEKLKRLVLREYKQRQEIKEKQLVRGNE